MPNWKTHIEIGKKANSYLGYNDEAFNLFLLGCILPDINNCYIVKNVSEKISHDTTHKGNIKEKSYIDFYNTYIDEIKDNDPLFVGYLLHLFTDYSFNNDFYTKKADFVNYDKETLRIMKQSDFAVFNQEFIENEIAINDLDNAIIQINKIAEISLVKEDIQKVIEFLHNRTEYKCKMNFYTIDELNELSDRVATAFREFLIV